MSEFDIEAIDEGYCVRPEGFFGGSQVRAMRSELESRVEAESTRIVLDLSRVEFVDSMGLGALLVFSNALRQAQGELILAAPPPKVIEVLKLTRLERVFTIESSVPTPVPSAS